MLFRHRRLLEDAFAEWHRVSNDLIPRGALPFHEDTWPLIVTPPSTASEALDDEGVWGAQACGVEVRRCMDEDAWTKGLGVFATRSFQPGEFVGLYWGERLTRHMLALRHGEHMGISLDHKSLTPAEAALCEMRLRRLARLIPRDVRRGAPIGGSDNGGRYVFELCGSMGRARDWEVCAVDAEDAERSSWCRHINHAAAARCNLAARMKSRSQLVWFEATRRIAPGEELLFSYSDSTVATEVVRWLPLVAVWVAAVCYVCGWSLWSTAST